MIVIVRIEVGAPVRRAIRSRLGRPGLATRSEVANLVECLLEASIEDAIADLDLKRRRRKASE